MVQEAHEFIQLRAALAVEMKIKDRKFRVDGADYSASRLAQFKQERAQELDRMLAQHPPSLDLPFVYPCQLQSGFRERKGHTSGLDLQFELFHTLCLGRQVLPEGRQSVMQALCPSSVGDFATTNRICLWKNAMALFDSDEDYEYAFHEDQVDGRRVVYFEWLARVHINTLSAVVKRLGKVEKGDECLRLNKSFYVAGGEEECTKEPLLFFLEHPAGIHIYCGRLGYLGHRGSNPPEFRWQLLDVASMDWDKIFNTLGLEY
ncbi:hypothetical protein PF008_g6639 [Phytophthora fragariae]|uniref:Uncharacterized protein n=1 Tax=Phytophthora fragariae TaxID=53985 RepID=A0A6G0S5G6_9STRA|nr:hypothetical protein PF008_g6639 [Phytophthora fragariae]